MEEGFQDFLCDHFLLALVWQIMWYMYDRSDLVIVPVIMRVVFGIIKICFVMHLVCGLSAMLQFSRACLPLIGL